MQAAWERFIERTMRARVPPPGVFIKPSQISNPSALKASHLEFAFECSRNKCFRNHGGSGETTLEAGEALRASNPPQFGEVQVLAAQRPDPDGNVIPAEVREGSASFQSAQGERELSRETDLKFLGGKV